MTTNLTILPVDQRLDGIVPDVERAVLEPIIEEIDELKKQRNAVVLAHNYMTPDIFHGVADLTRRLARAGAHGRRDRRRGDRHGRRPLHGRDGQDRQPDEDGPDPGPRAGCSLAESITGADVRLLRERYPGVPVVTYVNTSAEVKAESDICCTSRNAVAGRRVARRRPGDLPARPVPRAAGSPARPTSR